MISVLVPTNRVGGLDVLFSGLAVQSHKDLELVLIDDLRAFRGHLVYSYAKEYDLRVTHVAPWKVPQLECGLYEPGHYQRALNTGLAHAKGDVVIVLCDYTYLHPETVAIHADYQQKNRGNRYSMLGQVNCLSIREHLHPGFPERYGWYSKEMNHDPALHKDATFVPSYQPWMSIRTRLELMRKWRATYELDLLAGALDRFMWSVFEYPVTPETDVSKFRVWQEDKSEMPGGQVSHQYCNLKNCSFATDDIIAINGWDEELDGSHGHQDSELAGRLEKQLGETYWLFHPALASLFDPHGVAIIRGMPRGDESANLAVYNRKWNSGVWEGGAAFDIKTRREELAQCRPAP